MPKATAVWLVENTSLTFNQIADFCGIHPLEVRGIADGDVAAGIIGQDPILAGQLTGEEIALCEKNPDSKLKLKHGTVIEEKKVRKTHYTPIARRQDKPDGIAFLLKYYPNITNSQIKKLVGTTDKMIDSIRNRTHWNMKGIKPRDVVLLGLCNQSQFNEIVLAAQQNEPAPDTSTKKVKN